MNYEHHTPQLVMRRGHLRDLPRIDLPQGYSIRSLKEEDENSWNRIIQITFESPEYDFNKVMRTDEAFQPERVFFVTYKEEPVATASAWQVKRYGPTAGYLHMVGVSPKYQGKHLGYWVSLAVLHRFVTENRIEAVLQTDDFRLPAIKTYLRMRFEPLLVHENQRDRWSKIFQNLGRMNLISIFAPILSGSIVGAEELSPGQ